MAPKATAEMIKSKTTGKKEYPGAERLKSLKDSIINAPMSLLADRSHIVTEYYKRSDGVPAPLRRAEAFKEVMEKMGIAIWENELLVGGLSNDIRGCQFYPEYSSVWLKEELSTLSSRETEQRLLSEEDKNIILEDIEYWEGKSLEEVAVDLWRDISGDRIHDANEHRVFLDFKGGVLGRCHPDYEKIMKIGLNGLIQEVEDEIAAITVNTNDDLKKRYFLEAIVTCCEGVISFAGRHADLARKMAVKEKDEGRRKELEKIAEICSNVPANPAQNFYEALQSQWFVHLAILIEATGSGYSPGRMDQYMNPFYQKDINSGEITKDKAHELLGCLWLKFSQVTRVRSLALAQVSHGTMYQNVTVGGETRQGVCAVNDMSYLILDVTEHLSLPQPTVSVRYNDRLPEDFVLRACEVVSKGGGIPAFFMDKYAYAALPLYNIPLEHVRDWAPVGCVELMVPTYGHGSWAWSFYSLGKCMELALNNGIDPESKKQLGPTTGEARGFNSYDELFEAFRQQVIYAIETTKMASHSYRAQEVDMLPVPFASSLINDCIKKGRDIRDGGPRYNVFVSTNPRGHVTTSNSLYAIKKMVFEDKEISMDELLDALSKNFEGKDDLRKRLKALPKYGNDIDEVDQIVSDVFQLCEKEARALGPNPFGDVVTTTNQGIGMHYVFGSALGATPDGRKAYTPTADGSLSAYPGTDMNGPTALFKSAAKIEVLPCLSSLLNVKIHPGAVKGLSGYRKLMNMIKTYSDLGGYLVQFNIVDQETLLDAKENPEEYRDLTVRVAGFTAFWSDLAPGVQDEIIARTNHGL